MLDSRMDDLSEGIRSRIRLRYEQQFETILKEHSEVLQEMYEIGITSRLSLSQTQPIEIRIERVRKEMEDLASDLEVQLPSLPKKYSKVRRRLESLAAFCYKLSGEFIELERRAQEKIERETQREMGRRS